MINEEKLREIRHLAARLRRDIILMVGVGQTGHIGGSCSAADIVAVLYGWKMKHDPKNPKWEGRDRFLMSKGHSVPLSNTPRWPRLDIFRPPSC